MEYKKVEIGSTNIHLIKTNKFKTIYTLVTLSEKISKDNISKRNMLSGLLSYSCKKYPSRRDLMIAREDLYSAIVLSNTKRTGAYHELEFSFTCLEDKYTEKGNIKNCFSLLHEIIFNPLVEDNHFNEEAFSIVKDLELKNAKSVTEDKGSFSVIRMYEEMAPNTPISIRSAGYVDNINEITSTNLYEYYKCILNSNIVDIYIVGNIDFKEVTSYIKEYIPFKTYISSKYNAFSEELKTKKKPIVIKEKMDMNQSKLTIGCNIDSLSPFDLNYSLTLYNLILGGTADAKFFKNIREKYSVAYYVDSSPRKLDHILAIKSGIDKANYDKTLELIKHEMKDMEKGNFTEEEMNSAKKTYINMLKSITDNPNAIAYSYAVTKYINIEPLEEREDLINKVTKEDIMNVAKHIHINTIYLLEGEHNEEN